MTPAPGASPDGSSDAAGAARAAEAPPPSLTAGTRILLVRHGVTDLTTGGRLDGRGGCDPDLSEEGRRQAQAAAQRVAALVEGASVRVVTSALARARQTGAAVGDALGVSPVVDDGWDEQDLGEWDGASLRELAAAHGQDLLRLRNDPEFPVPGGETHADLRRRVLEAFERAAAAGDTVVVVTHRTPMMAVLGYLLGTDLEHAWRLALDPASLTVVRVWPDGGCVVDVVNDTTHLHR